MTPKRPDPSLDPSTNRKLGGFSQEDKILIGLAGLVFLCSLAFLLTR